MRTGRLRGWQISKAYHEHRPDAAQAKAQPSGLMPYDSAFMFDAQDCIRTKDTAYTPDGGLAILYGQLAPEGSVVKTAGISDEFKKNCGPGFVFEGPCVIFESQDDACAGILAGKVKAGDVVIIRNEGPRGGPGMQEMLSPDQLHRRHGPGRQGRAHHRRPFQRRHGGRLHRPRLARSGGRRPDRPARRPATASASISRTAASTSWFPKPSWPSARRPGSR